MNRPYDWLKLRCLCGVATKKEIDKMYAIIDREIMGDCAYKVLIEKNKSKQVNK